MPADQSPTTRARAALENEEVTISRAEYYDMQQEIDDLKAENARLIEVGTTRVRLMDDDAKNGECILAWGEEIGWRMVYHDSGPHPWCDPEGLVGYAANSFSHYMPLPEPPL